MRPATPPRRPPRSFWALALAGCLLFLLAIHSAAASWREGGRSLPRRAGPPASPSPPVTHPTSAGAIAQVQLESVGEDAPRPTKAMRVGAAGDEAAPPGVQAEEEDCVTRPAFVLYEPSPWEAEWAARLAASTSANASFCAAARADGDRAARFLAWVAAADTQPPPADLVSSMAFTCTTATGANATWSEPIEPLVGLLRHPYAVPACTPPGAAGVHIEDRSYLVLRRRCTAHSPTAPRALLFDAGANTYASSLGWLVDAYAARGIHFDAMYAWEAAMPLNASWWAPVPPAVAPRLHAINAPVALGTAMDPLAWMRDLARPGDMVVFKLDVGAGQTERAFVNEIAGSWSAGVPYVLEFLYEFHFGEPALQPWFGPPGPDTLSLADAAAALAKMRASGVRAHYWP